MNHPSHELTLGSLDLIGRMDQGTNFRLIVTGDDATWGNPQSVTSTLKGLLRDGARVSLESWENREAFLRVVIMSGTGDGLAEGEAALFAELGKRNELTWTPSGGFSTPTVFDVEWSELAHDFKPVTEALGRVEYGVKLVCQPFARSVNPTLSEVMAAPPPPAAPVVVTVDDCNTATGWTANPSPALSDGDHVYNPTWTGLLPAPPPWRLCGRQPHADGCRALRRDPVPGRGVAPRAQGLVIDLGCSDRRL